MSSQRLETTAAPAGSTAVPEQTTAAPEGTTGAAPEQATTAAPGGTTAAPGGTTAASEGTTGAPEQELQAVLDEAEVKKFITFVRYVRECPIQEVAVFLARTEGATEVGQRVGNLIIPVMTYEVLTPEGAEAQSKPQKKAKSAFKFADTDAIKQKVRDTQLRQKPYDVADFYYETGFFRALATNQTFENITLGVIVANALWMSFDTDGNDADSILDAKPIFVLGDVVFFSYFLMEVSVRFMAFERKVNCLKDNWFKFDACLVTLYAFDPFGIGLMIAISGSGTLNLPTAILRLFRLARLSRLVRMLRSFPQLMTMIKGMITATASVGYTLGLLLVITYVFAIALRNLVPKKSDIEDKYFPSVAQAMINLIIYGTFLDALSDFMLAIQEQSTACFIICWMYIGSASLTVMNMLVGVLCEVITAVAAEENESMNIMSITEKFESIGEKTNTPGELNWTEFQAVWDDPDKVQALRDVGVDPAGMVELSEDFFFVDGTENNVTVEEFMEMVLDARGSQTTTVKDIMHLGKRFNQKFVGLKMRIDGIDSKLETILNNMG